uniref:Uncharacterized protein n=1 Tax=Arundo donax TaxID=35708 RepID=A0A0A8ZUB2_ARUDO
MNSRRVPMNLQTSVNATHANCVIRCSLQNSPGRHLK